MATPEPPNPGPPNLGLAQRPPAQNASVPGVMPGGRVSAISQWALQRAQGGLAQLASPFVRANTPAPPVSTSNPVMPVAPLVMHPAPGGMASSRNLAFRREPWMGPGQAQQPMAPRADVAGRAFDFPVGVNMTTSPRREGTAGGISFEQLRQLADAHDLTRLCIETRKDQMSKLTWSVLPKQAAGQALRAKADSRCSEVEQFFLSPDRKHTFDQWQRMLLEDAFVLDAASIYLRPQQGGGIYSLDLVDGSSIKPLLDTTGRAPDPPNPAFQQHLKGIPAVDYTSDELLYAVRNPRTHKIYGMSPVEQIVLTVNIALRREVAKLAYFTENNIPEALVSVPKEWTPEQIARFQVAWDALLRAQQNQAGLKFVPGDMRFQPTRSDAMLMGPFDEWLARVVCYAFSLPPTAFVQQQNRATAEQANDTGLEEGLAPLMVWFKGVIDRIIQRAFGFADIEFVYDDIKDMDPAEAEARELEEIRSGLKSIDEVRAKRGLDPVGMGPAIFGIGPAGVMFIDDLLEAHAAGLLKIQPPPPPQQFDAMGNPMPPDPSAMPPGAGPPGAGGMIAAPPAATPARAGNMGGGGMPAPAPRARPAPGPDPLAGIPASILAAVGLGPGGAGSRSMDVTRGDEIETDPEMAHVPSKQVLAVLRAAEARNNGQHTGSPT